MEEQNNHIIRKKIASLEKELSELKSKLHLEKTVSVPKEFEPVFVEAQKNVNDYFKNLILNPTKGTIEINDQRYILVRASTLSNEFFENLKDLYKEKEQEETFQIASNFLFDIGHLMGKQDAKKFHDKLNLTDPLSKLSAGPVHFAYAGWAYVDILPESTPTLDDNFFLKYNHPYSFEADSWIKDGKKTNKPVCVMNAAYSSGWCEESFGFPLTAVEISCRAKGDKNCTFIMAPPNKIDKVLDKELQHQKTKFKPQIPFFFERKKIEEKLLKNSEVLNLAQRISKLGSWEYNLDKNELYWSDELYNIFDINKNFPGNQLFSKYLSYFTEDGLKDINLKIKNAIEKGEQYTLIHKIVFPNGSFKWLRCTGVPEKNKKGKVYKLSGYAQDITEKHQTEIELNQFFKLSNDLLCLANFDGYFLKLSYGWKKTLGFSQEEMTKQPFVNLIHPDDVDKTIKEMSKLKKGKNTVGFENRYRCKNGGYKILQWNASPDIYSGFIYCIVRDVTKEREDENKLKSTLHEKEILLKEVHHRVKNNLQIISSLINLQSSLIDDKNIYNLYLESQNRIKSIASIHELLYQSTDTGKIDFKDYFNKLIPDLVYTYYGNENNINFKIKTKLKLNIDTAIPLGLMVNEIISNALKHGLKNQKNDTILIDLIEKNKNFQLKISDNGIGFHYKKSKEKSNTLGLMLIEELTSQLNGNLTVISSPEKGTEFTIKFQEIN